MNEFNPRLVCLQGLSESSETTHNEVLSLHSAEGDGLLLWYFLDNLMLPFWSNDQQQKSNGLQR